MAYEEAAAAAIGRTLRQHTGQRAVVGRAGGEEFVVADVTRVAESCATRADIANAA